MQTSTNIAIKMKGMIIIMRCEMCGFELKANKRKCSQCGHKNPKQDITSYTSSSYNYSSNTYPSNTSNSSSDTICYSCNSPIKSYDTICPKCSANLSYEARTKYIEAITEEKTSQNFFYKMFLSHKSYIKITTFVVALIVVVGITIYDKVNSNNNEIVFNIEEPTRYSDTDDIEFLKSRYINRSTYQAAFQLFKDYSNLLFSEHLPGADNISVNCPTDNLRIDKAKQYYTGTIKYKSFGGDKIETTFEVCTISTTYGEYGVVYLKISDYVIVDYHDYVDSDGLLTAEGAEHFNRYEGSIWLDSWYDSFQLITTY